MASIFNKRGKYWLKYHDPETGKWKIKPTPLIYPDDAVKARQLKAETTAAELRNHTVFKIPNDQRWNSWVPGYMLSRYGADSKTYHRYSNSWAHLSVYLDEARILTPAGWKPETNLKYVEWKTEQKRTKSGNKAVKKKLGLSRNGALYDIGVMAMIMNEAKRREYITQNTASKARIKKGKAAVKPVVSDEEVSLIRAELVKSSVSSTYTAEEQKMFRNLAAAFEICLYTGCRIAEASIPFDRIDLLRGTITFIPKGGEDKAFSAPIFNEGFKEYLRNLIQQRREAGYTTTCNFNGNTSRAFARVCDRIGLPNVTFHCLRVTFVTRAVEAGLDGEVIRKLVNHADKMINRIYQRMSIAGLQGLGARLQMPSAVSVAQPSQKQSAKPKRPVS